MRNKDDTRAMYRATVQACGPDSACGRRARLGIQPADYTCRARGRRSHGDRDRRLHVRRAATAGHDHGSLRYAVDAARLAARHHLQLSRCPGRGHQVMADAASRRGAVGVVWHPRRGTRRTQCHRCESREPHATGGSRRAHRRHPARQPQRLPAQLALPQHTRARLEKRRRLQRGRRGIPAAGPGDGRPDHAPRRRRDRRPPH